MHILATSDVLFDASGMQIKGDELIARLKADPDRILADDEIGLVLYTGDLEIYTQAGIGDPVTGSPPIVPGAVHIRKVLQISLPRPEVPSIRHQIGSAVVSVAADAVFFVREGNAIRRVRGEHLSAGMILVSGEKVYW